MKLICDKIDNDCNTCPHSIPHDHSEECDNDCPDVYNCKCIPEIKQARKQKLHKLYDKNTKNTK